MFKVWVIVLDRESSELLFADHAGIEYRSEIEARADLKLMMFKIDRDPK